MQTQATTMASEFPQLAFQQWLARAARRVVLAIERDDAHEAFFSRAVDLADLERRQRVVERGEPIHAYW